MTAINSTLASAFRQFAAQQAQQSASVSALSSGSGTGFGNAVNVTLSPSAQAVVNVQGTATASNDNAAAQSSKGGHGSKGAPPVLPSGSSATTDTETLIQEALQQVIPKVGVTDASEVIDSQGNIDQVKLQQLIDQQLTQNTSV